MFKKITKGQFTQGLCNTYNQNGLCIATARNDGNLLEDAEFITYCFNLQQRLDIGMLEKSVRLLEYCGRVMRNDPHANIDEFLAKIRKS